MIIIRIMGGLGNQLFQYVFGRTLSLKYNSSVYFDIADYSRKTTNISREFELKKFPKIKAKFYDSVLMRSLVQMKLIEKIKEDNYDNFVYKKYSYKPIYLSGYWQSLKYFKEFENIIRQELDLKEPNQSDCIKEIKENNSVAIHVRLTDYLSINNVNIYTQLAENYYKNSIDLIKTKIDDPSFFIFSDDIESAKQIFANLKENLTFVEKNINSIYDFQLMKICKHNIIANSTFSWWAAWLNQNKGKVVVAPKRWNTDKSIEDLYPEDWILI